MFWTFFILGWILVHGATKGSYRFSGVGNVPSNVGGIVFALSLIGALLGMSDAVSSGGSLFLAAFLWIGILLLRTSLASGAAQVSRDATELRERLERRVGRASGRLPQVHHVGRIPGEYRRDEKQPGGFVINIGELDKGSPSDLEEAMSVVRDVLEIPDKADRLRDGTAARHDYVFDGSEIRELDEVPQQQLVSPPVPEAVEEALPVARPEVEAAEIAAEAAVAALPADEPPAGLAPVEAPALPEAADAAEDVPVEEASTVTRGWSAPQIDHARYELDDAGEKPRSIFASTVPSLSSTTTSLFGSEGERPLTAKAAEDVDRLLQNNRLSSHDELTRPQAVLRPGAAGEDVQADTARAAASVDRMIEGSELVVDEELVKPENVLDRELPNDEKEHREGFRYKPTEGIKSRF